MSDRISSTFHQRREMEQAIAAMAQTDGESELLEAARAVASAWPAALILPALLKQLPTSSSQLRGGLARLATLLPADGCVAALRDYATNRANTPQGRATAAMILERFLNAPLPAALLSDLQGGNDAAEQSLIEAVEEGRRTPHVLLEYVTQMQQHGEEIAALVMQHLDRLPPQDRVELLRLIAQDRRPGPARAALLRLEALAAAGKVTAAQALYTLRWALLGDGPELAERALRKLHFRGLGYTPPQPQGWQALLTPARPSGTAWLMLTQLPAGGRDDGAVFALEVGLGEGIRSMRVSEGLSAQKMPRPRGPAPGAPIPFDEALWLVQRLLGRGAAPAEFALYNARFFQFAPAPEAQIAALLDAPPAEPYTQDEAAPVVEALLRTSAMAEWLPALALVESRLVNSLLAGEGMSRAALARAILQRLGGGDEIAQLNKSLRDGLLLQSLYLAYAGDGTVTPQQVQRLAHTVPLWTAETHLLLRQMIIRGLALRDQGRSISPAS